MSGLRIHHLNCISSCPLGGRHIVLTHLDFDHAGGLDDFPHAKVHLMRQEPDHAVAQRTWLDRQRFRPQQWASARHNWVVHEPGLGERWFGFDGVRQPTGLPPDVLLVPLLGHTLGHAGVAVHSEGRWRLLAGDAYFNHREMDLQHPWCTPGLRMYQTLMEKDRRAPAQPATPEAAQARAWRHGGHLQLARHPGVRAPAKASCRQPAGPTSSSMP